MKKILGVLGGMGPQATVDLLQKIVDLTVAHKDQEHIHILVDNYPQVPERISAILRGTESPGPALQQPLDKLAVGGADVLVIPCVTAHHFLDEVRMPQGTRFISMLTVTASACAKQYAGQTAGLLASPATLQSGMLARALAEAGVTYLAPSDEEREELGRLIFGVKAGQDMADITARFAAVLLAMLKRGADYFVLGCTELPLIAQACQLPYAVVDATTELAKAAILACGYELKSGA